MFEIELIEELATNIEPDLVKNYIKRIVKEEKNEKDVSILFTNNDTIRKFNSKWRGKDKATDVLSFPYNDEISNVLGDIIISIEKIKEQAVEYSHSYEREFFYILTHGILHILGYDHEQEEDKKIMREKEEYYLSKLEIKNQV